MAYGADTTTDEVLEGVDLSGALALVTGASSGLGKETARALASAGARVVMTARDTGKGEAALSDVAAAVPDADIELMLVDLASLDSVRAFTDAFLERHDALQLLIANAGVMASPFGHTADVFELQFGTNHLGHFVLVNRLVPAVVRGAPGRIVVVSSYAHQFSDVDLEDPNFEHSEYDKFAAYGRSKTANVLFAVELDRRLRDQGVRSYALHPGGIRTELGRHINDDDLVAMRERLGRRPTDARYKSIAAGAATTVWAATSDELADRGGTYLEDCAIAAVKDALAPNGVRDYALDPEGARALWRRSEELVGEQFPE